VLLRSSEILKRSSKRFVRNDSQIELVHGKPLLFGKNGDKGIRFHDEFLQVVTLGEDGITDDDVIVHDETRERPSRAFQLSQMDHPDFPIPIGVFRAVSQPCYDREMNDQIAQAIDKEGPGDLEALLNEGDVWEV